MRIGAYLSNNGVAVEVFSTLFKGHRKYSVGVHIKYTLACRNYIGIDWLCNGEAPCAPVKLFGGLCGHLIVICTPFINVCCGQS